MLQSADEAGVLRGRHRRPPPAGPLGQAGKLGDIRYVYTWAGERVFKVVSFFLFRYARGLLGDISPEHTHEVAETAWLPLDEAPRLLAYKGEREMAARALDRLGSAG